MTKLPISAELPPLVLGTATFNYQYNPDAFQLPTTAIVHHALSSGAIRAFDTSPYYGPSEILLGEALRTSSAPRSSYKILTKVGRIASSEFDYSRSWIRHSIQRSLKRLHTDYLDLVFCHDVEFVSATEVLEAVKCLRELRDDEGKIRYIGISGYPVDTLCQLAEMILKETGEPLDAVQNYANHTLQNSLLHTRGVERLKTHGGVECVLNASPLGMGLMRSQGVPIGSMGDFHPASQGLRSACLKSNEYTMAHGDRLETVAIRWTLENWVDHGAPVGAASLRKDLEIGSSREDGKMGATIIGVSFIEELEETLRVWNSVLAARRGDAEAVKRRDQVAKLANGVVGVLGEWHNTTWDSPGSDYVRSAPNPQKYAEDDVLFPALKQWKASVPREADLNADK